MKVKMKIKKRLILVLIVVIVAMGAIYKHHQDVKFEKKVSSLIQMSKGVVAQENQYVFINPEGEYIPVGQSSLLINYTTGAVKITKKNYKQFQEDLVVEIITYSLAAQRIIPFYSTSQYTVIPFNWYNQSRSSAYLIVRQMKEDRFSCDDFLQHMSIKNEDKMCLLEYLVTPCALNEDGTIDSLAIESNIESYLRLK